MSLQGTLDTVALPDVLRLLEGTAKTGRLQVGGGGLDGNVWIDGGQVIASECNGTAPLNDHVAVLFELLRLREGAFNFDADSTPDHEGLPGAVNLLLIEAEKQLAEWREIEAVVPSLESWVVLRRDLDGDQIVISADEWRAIVALGAGSTVGSVGESLGLGQLPVSRFIKSLIERGLAKIETAPVSSGTSAAPVPEDFDETKEGGDPPMTADLDEVGPATSDDEQVIDEDDPINRGTLLKFLSSVRT